MIADTGTGMLPEVLARVFEPFFTTKDIGKGSGLGLAQAHGFAKASRGAVRVQSDPRSGTTVSLYLPRTDKLPSGGITAKEVAMQASASNSQGVLMLVEDDDDVAALAQPDQVLATAEVADAADAAGMAVTDLGPTTLRGTPQPVDLYAITACTAVPDRVLDPVCHMAVDRSRAAATRIHRGAEHLFCSLECAAAFDLLEQP